MMFSRSIYLPTNFKVSLFFSSCCVVLYCVNVHLLIHSLVEGQLGCFQVPVMTNNVEHMSLWYDSASFGYIPKSGIAGS